MNFKRISAAALAAALTAAMLPAALAAERPEGWTPADGARGPMLISPNPTAAKYDKVITVNGDALESYVYDREVPGWGSESVTVQLSEIPNVPTGYVPLRAVIQADEGSAYWDEEEYCSTFYYGNDLIVTNFHEMSVSVNDEKVEGAEALLLEGVTYVPVSVLDLLEGVTVTDNTSDAGESYEITTPNGTPLMKLAKTLRETAGIGMGMKATPAELEEFYGESLGFKAEYMTEGVIFLPMMVTPDTLVVGKAAQGQTDALKECFEAFRKTQEETFTWYLPDNLPKTQNAKFVTSGDWFMFLIGENADEAVAVFEAGVAEMK